MAGGFSDAGSVVVMPMWKRTVITAVQLTMTLITAGVIIGYGQLFPMLVDSGVYHDKCDPGTPTSDMCPKQVAALDQLFFIGASVSMFVQAPSGIILDFLGPRITCWVGLVMFVPGCFLFAFAESITAIDAYMCGFQLLAMGGPFVFISSLPVAQLWPDKQAMILMMINGVYGGGAFVFFLFSILYNNAHVSMKDLFVGYGILGCFIVVIAFFVWPRRAYAETNKTINSKVPVEKPTVSEIVHKSLKDMYSWHYVFLTLFVALLIFKSNFFLSTMDSQFQLHMTPHQATVYSGAFGVLLPGVGILAGPIGLIFDKFGSIPAMMLLITLSTISSICGLMVYSNTIFVVFQVIRMVIFSAYFPMIYGVWAFIIIEKYGTTNFGFLYGTIAVFAGILNISASNPLNKSALHAHSYVPANFILAIVGGIFIIYPIVELVRRRVNRVKYGSGYYEPIINS